MPDLRDHLLSAYGEPPASPPGVSAPNLQIEGRIGVSEEFTTNAGFGGNAGSDFITFIQPGITIIDNSQRLQVNLDYAPIGEIYAENSNYSQIQQQGSGDILVTLLPSWLYLDLRGSISQQSIFGGLGPVGTVSLSPNDRETISSVSISPYAAHTFGGTGTAEVGVGYSYTATDAPNSITSGATAQSQLLLNSYLQNGVYGSSALGTERLFANFVTGENYGRLRDKIALDANFYTGNSALGGGRRVLVTNDASYAVSRVVAVLGEIGFESMDYPHAGYGYVGPIGAAGVQLTPRPGSTLLVEYRYVDGFGSPLVQFSVQATPRIRVFGGYSEGITTFDQDLQNTLLDESNTITGVEASALVAAPLLTGSNFFGGNQNLVQLRRLDISATWLLTYDTITASLQHETTDPIGRPQRGIPVFATSATFGSITERHEISDTLYLDAFAQYGTSQTAAGLGSGDTVSVSVGVDKSFPHALTAFARVSGTYYVSGNTLAALGYAGQGGQTSVLIGVLKRF